MHVQEHAHHKKTMEKILTIRAHSGLAGDMMLAGLIRMAGLDQDSVNGMLASVMPELAGCLSLVRREVHGIGGWHASVSLPHQHAHRNLADILSLIDKSGLSSTGKTLSKKAFTMLALAEASVHGKKAEEVHFHEIGALDSILDICLNCELFQRIAPDHLVVSPLPVADGAIRCAHGIIPSPAPAVLELLDGVPVRTFAGSGETVTPTALALLKTLGARFGPWPDMNVEKHAIVYGTYVFEDAPNGAFFALGEGPAPGTGGNVWT